MHTTIHRNPFALFALGATLLTLTCLVLLRSSLFASNPDILAWGVTFDLTITLPLLYWALVVRTGRARAVTIAPVMLAGTLIASILIPSQHQQFLSDFRWLVVPLVVMVIEGAFVWGVWKAWRERSDSPDPWDRIHHAARAIAGKGRIAELAASEITMFYYATFGWKARAQPTPGRKLTFHRTSGWDTVLACILVLMVAEGIGMHLFLSLWSSLAAWIWTALDIWAVVWLLGDYHALRLRPSWIDDEAFHLRFGMRWSVDIPREMILSVAPIAEGWERKDVLKVAILEEPRIVITLREPLEARGLAGLRKTICAVALAPDTDDTFRDSDLYSLAP